MNRKYKIGEKVKILWAKTVYSYGPDYADVGEVIGNLVSYNGTHLVELNNFHKDDKRYNLYFPIDTLLPLKEVVKDGDTL